MERLTRTKKFAQLREQIASDREETKTTKELGTYEDRLNSLQQNFEKQNSVFEEPKVEPVVETKPEDDDFISNLLDEITNDINVEPVVEEPKVEPVVEETVTPVEEVLKTEEVEIDFDPLAELESIFNTIDLSEEIIPIKVQEEEPQIVENPVEETPAVEEPEFTPVVEAEEEPVITFDEPISDIEIPSVEDLLEGLIETKTGIPSLDEVVEEPVVEAEETVEPQEDEAPIAKLIEEAFKEEPTEEAIDFELPSLDDILADKTAIEEAPVVEEPEFTPVFEAEEQAEKPEQTPAVEIEKTAIEEETAQEEPVVEVEEPVVEEVIEEPVEVTPVVEKVEIPFVEDETFFSDVRKLIDIMKNDSLVVPVVEEAPVVNPVKEEPVFTPIVEVEEPVVEEETAEEPVEVTPIYEVYEEEPEEVENIEVPTEEVVEEPVEEITQVEPEFTPIVEVEEPAVEEEKTAEPDLSNFEVPSLDDITVEEESFEAPTVEDIAVEEIVAEEINEPEISEEEIKGFVSDILSEVNDHNKNEGLTTMDELPNKIINEVRGVVEEEPVKEDLAPVDEEFTNTVSFEVNKLLEEINRQAASELPVVKQPVVETVEVEEVIPETDVVLPAIEEHPVLTQTLVMPVDDGIEIESLSEIERRDTLAKTIPFVMEDMQEDEEEEEEAPNKVLNIILTILIIALLGVLAFVAYELFSANIF